jgi:phosphoserine phosphatase RsbU/P
MQPETAAGCAMDNIPIKPSLLVVDDEPANLQKLKRTFFSDFAVREARTGEEALRYLRAEPFSAIITDQRMPGISGVELLRESLALSPQAVRIILTGYTEVEDLMAAINEGQVHRYIVKPWDPFSLRRTVLQDLELQRLREETRAMGEQLRIAAQVQSQLFPNRRPLIPHLDYAGICRLARSVGGDYYDFLELQPGKLWIAVGDISGKGISAALLMANLQGLLRSHAPLHADELDRLFGTLNDRMCGTCDGSQYASLFYARFDGETRTLRYVNAGHPPPFLVRAGAVDRLPATGPPVGLFVDSLFSVTELQLQAGDTLIVYTDGIIEAERPDGEMFGEERLEAMILERYDLAPAQLIEAILESASLFTGGAIQHDDQAVVAARVC